MNHTSGSETLPSSGQTFRWGFAVWGVILACLFLVQPQVWSMSASPHPVQLTQPDGTMIMLRIRGDHDFNWFVDAGGYTVLLHNGAYVYATLDASGWLAPTGILVGIGDPVAAGLTPGIFPTPEKVAEFRETAGTHSPVPASKMRALTAAGEPPPSAITPVGTIKNLVILCKFSDHDDTKTRTREDFDVVFNSVGGSPTLAPTGSVKDYFTEASYGTVTLNSTVVAWVTLPNTEAYYGNGTHGITNTYPRNGQGMVEHALALADALVDFGQFDSNNDGYVDAIDIIHSGYAAETGGGAGNWIWSHKWSLWAVPGGRWTSQDNNSGGVKVKVLDYHTEAALWGTSGTGITRIGVICHETGHFFGLPDLYDTDGTSEGIGSYCLMANSWGFDFTQLHPPHPSAWCKQQLGWVTPTVITPGSTYSLPRVALTPTVHRINSDYPTGEYLLIENRQPFGFENVMPQGGLAIWHIDENKAGNTEEGYPGQSGWPTNNKHYKIALLQADGLYQMERDQNRGNAGDVYHGAGVNALTSLTVPNTHRYQGGTVASTRNWITGISAAGNTMSYTYSHVTPEDYFTELFAAGTHDLDNQSFLFTPQAGPTYAATRHTVTGFPTPVTGGTALSLTDNSFAQVTLTGGKQVSFYGQNYSSFFVGSNGYITFTSGSNEAAESLGTHFSLRRISGFFDDL
ncbi:MAG TPA: M6 family metalloprotease domain-containing protein, partial [Prosthecobacter sp.]